MGQLSKLHNETNRPATRTHLNCKSGKDAFFYSGENMPYENENDPKLPDNVKKLDESKRKKWIAVFNSAIEDTENEGEAMAIANGAVKAMSFEATCNKISRALYDKFGGDGLGVYVAETYPDYVIAEFESEDERSYFQVPYAMDDTEIVFEDRVNWQKVKPERTWIEAKAGRRNNSSDAKMIQDMHDSSVKLGATCGEMKSNFLKAISETDDELRVGNYIVLFGGRDLEGVASPLKNQDGSRGEYFSPSTVLESEYTAKNAVAIDWEHGRKEFPKDVTFGYVDWSTKSVDERGVFVERVLNRRNKYVQWVEKLIKAGLVGTSSEPVQTSLQKAVDGHILKWPLFRDSLTVQPMEPRMLKEFGGNELIEAAKALGVIPQDEVKNIEVKNQLLLRKIQLRKREVKV